MIKTEEMFQILLLMFHCVDHVQFSIHPPTCTMVLLILSDNFRPFIQQVNEFVSIFPFCFYILRARHCGIFHIFSKLFARCKVQRHSSLILL